MTLKEHNTLSQSSLSYPVVLYPLHIYICTFSTAGASVFWKFTSDENPFEEQEEEEEGEDFIDTGGVRRLSFNCDICLCKISILKYLRNINTHFACQQLHPWSDLEALIK